MIRIITLLSLLSMTCFGSVIKDDDSLDYGRVTRFLFNENTGTNIKSSVGSSTGKIYTNSILWTNGLAGSCLYFPNSDSNQLVLCTTSPVSAFPITVYGWFKMNITNPVQGNLITLASTNGNLDYFQLGINANLNCLFQMRSANGSGACTATNSASSSFTNGSWNLLTGIAYNTNHIAFYANGVFGNSNATMNAMTSFPVGINQISIGSHVRNTVAACFKGWLDEVGVYNRALTPAEILTMYNGGKGTD